MATLLVLALVLKSLADEWGLPLAVVWVKALVELLVDSPDEVPAASLAVVSTLLPAGALVAARVVGLAAELAEMSVVARLQHYSKVGQRLPVPCYNPCLHYWPGTQRLRKHHQRWHPQQTGLDRAGDRHRDGKHLVPSCCIHNRHQRFPGLLYIWLDQSLLQKRRPNPRMTETQVLLSQDPAKGFHLHTEGNWFRSHRHRRWARSHRRQ